MNSVFYMLSFTLFFWSLSFGLSNYLGQPAERKPAKKIAKEIQNLKEVVLTNPKDEKANMNLAFTLVQNGFEKGDMQLIMQAVQVFRNVLDINPKNDEALLGLASLCLQSGVLDKADSYYKRYLRLKPNDLNAKADYAMVQFKLNQADKGEGILKEIISADDKLFSAYAVGAIAYNTIANKEKFDFYLKKAKETAPSKDAILNLENTFKQKTENTLVVKETNPKKELEKYFLNHQIIGPKLIRQSWEGEILSLELKDFPVDKMPSFAKAKFISGVKEVVADNEYIVKILDSVSKKELMEVK